MTIYTDWPIAYIDLLLFCAVFWLTSVNIQVIWSIISLRKRLEEL